LDDIHNKTELIAKDKGTYEDLKDAIGAFFKIPDNNTETSNKINTVTTSLKSLQKTLSDSSSAITEIQSALDEYAENKAFSLDTLVALGDKHESLIGILGDEKAVHQELTNIIKQEQEKARQAYIAMLNGSVDFYNKNIEGIQKFVSGLDGAREVDLSGAKSLAEAKLKVEYELMKNLAGMWSQYYDAQGNMTNANIIDGGRTIVGQDGKETYITPEMRAQLKAYYDASLEVKKKFDDIAMSGTKSIDFSKLGMSKSDNKKENIRFNSRSCLGQVQFHISSMSLSIPKENPTAGISLPANIPIRLSYLPPPPIDISSGFPLGFNSIMVLV